MRLSARPLLVVLALATQGCINSSLVLHVNADGSGQAVVTSRIVVAGMQAFDSLFPAQPPQPPQAPPSAGELLMTPLPGMVDRAFGTSVRLVSSTMERSADGGTRRTVVDFSDVRNLRLTFPPEFALPGNTFSAMSGIGNDGVITFSIRQHENGDRLLIVKMPDPVVGQATPDEPITTFQTDSPEERTFRRAIKGLALRFTVELDQPLLRTNAPKLSENGATILDLDLDRMINAMDEPMVWRMGNAGSFQQILWQLGDLPGASIPLDHEVFLEYQAPQGAAQPPRAPATQTQAPPDTEIYLAPIRFAGDTITVGEPQNITNNPGYDNQPFFTADSRSILFTSARPSAPGGADAGTQTDIYRYDISRAQTTQVTNTPESEYSPTITPSGTLAVVRVDLDAEKTQRLWQFTADGRDPKVVLENVKPVGYFAWADDHTVALYILGATRGAPATLQLADTKTGQARVVATDIGRSIQRMPGTGNARHISFVQRETANGSASWVVKELDPVSGTVTPLAPAIDGATADLDTAWAPDGTLLAARNGTLYAWRRGDSGWKAVVSLEQMGLMGITRLAVSPRGNYLAVVAAPQGTR